MSGFFSASTSLGMIDVDILSHIYRQSLFQLFHVFVALSSTLRFSNHAPARGMEVLVGVGTSVVLQLLLRHADGGCICDSVLDAFLMSVFMLAGAAFHSADRKEP